MISPRTPGGFFFGFFSFRVLFLLLLYSSGAFFCGGDVRCLKLLMFFVMIRFDVCRWLEIALAMCQAQGKEKRCSSAGDVKIGMVMAEVEEAGVKRYEQER